MGLVQEQRWRAAPWEVWSFISLVGAQVGVVALMPGSTIRAGSGLLIYALIFGAFICGSWTARLLLIVMCAFELVGIVVLGSGGGWSVPPARVARGCLDPACDLAAPGGSLSPLCQARLRQLLPLDY